jgi:hypothetical protein
VGFVLGHLIAPIGKTLGSWVRHPGFKAPWREYDWLRMHRPDAGALVAKIRAEYTMHIHRTKADIANKEKYSLGKVTGKGLQHRCGDLRKVRWQDENHCCD